MDDSNYYETKYDYLKDTKIDWNRMKRWLESLADDICNTQQMSVFRHRFMLDVACGTGRTSKWANEWNTKIWWTGIESSKRAISFGERYFKCYIDLGNAEDLPYPTDAFDYVVCLGSLEHMKNPDFALREINRVCKPNGRIVILVPNRIPIFDWIFFDYGTEQEYEVKRTKKEWLQLLFLNLIQVHRVRRDFGPSLFKNFKPVAFIKRLMLKLTRILPHYFTYCWIFDCKPLGSKAHRGEIPLQKWDVESGKEI